MSAEKEFTLSELSSHTSKKDLYLLIHEKVYDTSSFVDEHPGGEEVLLDVGGQDATEAFEDVGHSDEAREILKGLLVGSLKRGENDPPAKSYSDVNSGTAASKGQGGSMGVGLYAVIFVGAALAFGAYQYLGQQQQKQ